MLPPIPPTAALRADLATREPLESEHDARDGDATFAPWLLLATVVHRLAGIDPAARATYARASARALDGPAVRRALTAWRGESAPEALVRQIQRDVESMERAGAFHLAQSTLQSLQPLIPRAERVLRGHVAAQLGRIARQMGQLDAAEQYYDVARELATEAGDGELAARADVGAGVVFVQRGNYPAARDAYTRALTSAPMGSPLARGAHHGLLLAATAAGDYDAAFSHGWQAFVHAHDDPNGRADALINLGRLCRKVHQYTTALHAFRASLALTTLPRLQLPALGGAILTASVLGDDATVDALSGVAERLAGAGEPVYECAAAWFDLATAAMTREAFAAADRYLRAARAITVPRGFHELTWQLDAMAEQLAARAGARRPGESLAARASNETTGRQEPTGDAALRLDPASSSVLAEIRALPIGDTLVAVLART